MALPSLDSFVGTQPTQIMGSSPTQSSAKPSLDSFLNTPVQPQNTGQLGTLPSPLVSRAQNSFLGQNIGQPIAQAFQSGIQQAQQGVQQSQDAMNQGGFGGYVSGLEGGVKAVAGGVNAAFSPLAPIFAPLGTLMNFASNKISDIPQVQQFAQTQAGQNVARAAEDVSNLSTIAGAGAGLGASPEAPKMANDLQTGIASKTEGIKTGFQNKVVNSTINDWNRIGGDYVKTDKLLSQQEAQIKNPNAPASVQDTPTFLAKNGITPQSMIKGGKFDTAEVASKLTTETVKPFEDILNKQLKAVQQGQPPVNIQNEVRPTVINNIKNIQGITEGDRATMLNAANRELTLLQNKYPNGIPLDVLNKQKGIYWSKTKFDITKPLQPQVNYNIGSAMKDVIEQKAGDANVRELNGVLGNYYKAGKFLNGLDGRVPKLTVAQKITRGVVKAGATAAGESLFGLSGGVGGFLLSKSISTVLENASNPLKGMILSGLEKSNPEAYTQAVKWLGEQEANRLKTPALPAGNSEGGVTTPTVIQPKAPTTYEAPAKSIDYQPLNGGKNSINTNIPTNSKNTTISPSMPESTPKVQASVPKELQPLAQEAQKYKSAEEFVNNKLPEKPVKTISSNYGETKTYKTLEQSWNNKEPSVIMPKGSTVFRGGQDGVYYSADLGTAEGYAGSNPVKGVDISGKKLANFQDFTNGKYASDPEVDLVSVVKKALNEGYDGLYTRDNYGEVILPTKSQLTDFYNKVKKK